MDYEDRLLGPLDLKQSLVALISVTLVVSVIFLTDIDFSPKLLVIASITLATVFLIKKPALFSSWKGTKAFDFDILLSKGDKEKVIEVRKTLERPGIRVRMEQTSGDETIALLEKEVQRQKTDLYALKAHGKSVPESMTQKHEDTMSLLESLQKGDTEMYSVNLLVDANRVKQSEALDLIRKARAVRPWAKH